MKLLSHLRTGNYAFLPSTLFALLPARHILRPAFIAGMLAVGTLGSASPAQAQQPQPIQLIQANPASLRVRIDNPAQLPGRVRVVQLSDGLPIYDQTYHSAAYGHRFDFDHLPDGRYALQLSVGADHYNYTVQVQTEHNHSTVNVCELTTRQTQSMVTAAAF
jgi:hypothetical protein